MKFNIQQHHTALQFFFQLRLGCAVPVCHMAVVFHESIFGDHLLKLFLRNEEIADTIDFAFTGSSGRCGNGKLSLLY